MCVYRHCRVQEIFMSVYVITSAAESAFTVVYQVTYTMLVWYVAPLLTEDTLSMDERAIMPDACLHAAMTVCLIEAAILKLTHMYATFLYMTVTICHHVK